MPQKIIIIEKSRPGDILFSGARWARVIVNERGGNAVCSAYEFSAEPLVSFINKLTGVDDKSKDRGSLEVVRHFEGGSNG